METCYRHPGRETGVHCSNCGRPICPDCMTSTPVGMRCPECANQRTKVRTVRSGAEDPTLTYILIGINVLVFLGGVFSGANAASGLGGSQLINDGAVSRFSIEQGEYYRLVTSGFLHAGFFHLAVNMFSLYILGTLLEPAIGRLRFGLIYAVSLLAGAFGALLFEPNGLTVGASGAIFGLMGAAAVVMWHRGVNLIESGLGIWIGLNLLITFTVSGISVGGHIGGLVGGVLAAFFLVRMEERMRLPFAVGAALCGGLCAAAVVGSIVVSSSTPV
jgi:membrane associated rhomboid family serine protease